jgi:hypothetical protein
MTACDELRPLIAARPLSVLEPEEEARVAEHLVLCAPCTREAERLAATLAEAVPDKRKAPDAAWAKLAERIARDQALPHSKEEPRVTLACSFCHAGLAKAEAVYCASCLAPHHADCFEEHGRCSAPGCGETQVVKPRAGVAPARRPRVRWRPLVLTLVVAGASAAALVEVEESRAARAQRELYDREHKALLDSERERRTEDEVRRAPGAIPEPAKTTNGLYRSPDGSFELTVPGGWVAESTVAARPERRLLLHAATESGRTRGEISVEVLDLPRTDSPPQKASMDALTEEIVRADLARWFGKTGGSVADEVRDQDRGEFAFELERDRLRSRFVHFLDLSAGRSFGVVASALQSDWSRYEPIFDSVASSFRVTSKLARRPVSPDALAMLMADAPIESGFTFDPSTRDLLGVGRDGVLYTLDGDLQRRRPAYAAGEVGTFGDRFSQLAIVGTHAYVGTTGGVLEIGLPDGVVERTLRVPQGSVVARPLVFPSGRIVVGTTAGAIVSFGPGSEEPTWIDEIVAPITQPGVALGEGGNYAGFVAADERFHAVSVDTGASVWAPVEVGAAAAPPVRCGDDRVVLVNAKGELVTLRVDPKDVPNGWWRDRWTCPGNESFQFAASADGKRVFVASATGFVAMLDGSFQSTTLEYRGEMLRHGAKVPRVVMLPATSRGREQALVVWGDGAATCFELDGTISHRMRFPAGSLSVAGDRVVISGEDGVVRSFDRP